MIPESDELNNRSDRKLPDLEPKGVDVQGTWWGHWLTGSWSSPARGIAAPVTVSVGNNGEMPPTFYRIHWTAHYSPAPAGVYEVNTDYNAPGGPGGGLTNALGLIQLANHAFLNTGDYDVCVRLDTEPGGTNGYVPESNEANNSRCATITVHEPLAELTPWSNWQIGPSPSSDLTLPPACYVENNTYPAGAVARNVGEIPTVNSINVRMTDTAAATIVPTAPQTIAAGFPIGGAVLFTYNWRPLAPGNHTLAFDEDTVLPLGAEPEFIDGPNNEIQRTVDVRPDQVDLAITGVAKKWCYESGETISPVARVVNGLGHNADQARVLFYLTDQSGNFYPNAGAHTLPGAAADGTSAQQAVSGCGGEASFTPSAPLTGFTAAGTYKLTAIAALDTPAPWSSWEQAANLADNIVTFDVIVGDPCVPVIPPPPDLYVWSEHINFTPDVWSFQLGNTFNINATIQNQGPINAINVPFEVRDEVWTWNSTLNQSVQIYNNMILSGTIPMIPAGTPGAPGVAAIPIPPATLIPYTITQHNNLVHAITVEIFPTIDKDTKFNKATKGFFVGDLNNALVMTIEQPPVETPPHLVSVGRDETIIIDINDILTPSTAKAPASLLRFNVWFEQQSTTARVLPNLIKVVDFSDPVNDALGTNRAKYLGNGRYEIHWTPDASTNGSIIKIVAFALDKSFNTGQTSRLVSVGGNSFSLAAAPASIPADGTSKSHLTATLTDADGNGVGGETVRFEVTGPLCPGNILVMTATTNTSGVAESDFVACYDAGVTAVRATVASMSNAPSDTESITLSAAPPVYISVQPSPVTVVADGISTRTVTARVMGMYGTPVSGAAVNFDTTGLALDGTIGATCTTQIDGTCTVTYTAGALVGAGDIKASVTGSGITIGLVPPLRVVQTPGPASALNITLSSANTTTAGPPIDVTATLTDTLGNGIPGVTIYVGNYSNPGCVDLEFNKVSVGGPDYPTDAAGQMFGKITPSGIVCTTNITLCVPPGTICKTIGTDAVTVGALFPVVTPIGISSIKFRLDMNVYDGSGNPADDTVMFESVGGVGSFSANPVLTSGGVAMTEFTTDMNDGDVDIRMTALGTGLIKTVSIHFKSGGNAYLAYSGDVQPLLNITEPANVPPAIQTAAVVTGRKLVSPVYLVEPAAFAPVSPTALVAAYNDNPSEESTYRVYHYDAGSNEWKQTATVNNTAINGAMTVISGGGYYAVLGDDTLAPVISGLEPADGSMKQPEFPRLAAMIKDEEGGTGVDPAAISIMLDGVAVNTSWFDAATGKLEGTPNGLLAPGEHLLNVKAADRAGNMSAESVSRFTVIAPPEIAAIGTIDPVSITKHQEPYMNYIIVNLTESAISGASIIGNVTQPGDPSKVIASFTEAVDGLAANERITKTSRFSPVDADPGVYDVILYYKKDAAATPEPVLTTQVTVESCGP